MSRDSRPKIVVIMPAYNAAKTLRMTYLELPHDVVDLVLLVDDASSDETVEVARQLNLELFIHNRNYGYGGNQKTCYAEALKAQADIIVMVHPDYQYDPTCLPQVIEPLQRGAADVVLGSRLMGVSPMKQGMPWWKYLGNRFLTVVENSAFGLRLSDTHGLSCLQPTGLGGGTLPDELRRVHLRSRNRRANRRGEIQNRRSLRADEVLAEASSASFVASAKYGLGILWLVVRYALHKYRMLPQTRFEPLGHRYTKIEKVSPPVL